MARLLRTVVAVGIALVLIVVLASGAFAITYFLQDDSPGHHHRAH